MKTCSFRGCGRPHFAHTLCHTHYSQKRRGDELTPIRARRNRAALAERDDQGRKSCPRCSQWLPECDFMPDEKRSDGLSTYCKPCRSAHARAWRYGLDPADVERMIRAQGGTCRLCPARLADGYCVDHNHECCPGIKTCGECVRGLLCQECNKLIGKLESDGERLTKMIAYLKESHG